MGATATVATTPATLVLAPSSYGLHQVVTIPGGAAVTLVSLLSGGALPVIPPNPSSPAGSRFTFGFVDIQVDDPTIPVRVTYDSQTAPTATVGFVAASTPAFTRYPVHPSAIQVISTGAAVTAQVYLGITGRES